MTLTQQERPFTDAFGAWFAAAADLHDIMAFEPCKHRDAVEINFFPGSDALHGYAHPAGINVSAIKDGECWDFLFDEDLVAKRDAAGWFCALCPSYDRRHYPSIAELWTVHFFEALSKWIDDKLRPATTIAFHGHNGATSAKLVKCREANDPDSTFIMLIASDNSA